MRGKEPMTDATQGDTPKTDKPKAIHYELPTGAVAILEQILPTPTWYKDDPKQARTIVAAVAAADALPETAARPAMKADETQEAFNIRVDTWAEPVLEFEWTDKQKEAAKKCVAHYIKGGNLSVNAHLVALIKLLGLDDE